MKTKEDEALPESDVFPDAPHPRRATTLVGHRRAETELLSAYRDGRLAHAWLISGGEGVGKATLAWRFARFVLANPDPAAPAVREANDLSVDPANPAGRLLAGLAHPDFSLVRRRWQADKKRFSTDIQIDDVREALKVFRMAPAFGGHRLCIVDCAEDLNRSSANALLKMVEEPPQKSLILIVSHRPGQLLPTLRSRCRRLKLDPLGESDLVEAIASLGSPWSEVQSDAIRSAARRAKGSVREALARLSPETENLGALIDSAMSRLPHCDFRLVAALADALAGRAADEAYQAFYRELYDWLAGYAARAVRSAAAAEEFGALWDRIRTAARETDDLNLDRRMSILSIFAEIAQTARRVA